MSKPMTDAERRAFLTSGTRTGKLAVTRKDGSPHVTAIWFVLDGDDVCLTTWHESIKYRVLRRDPRAEMVVDEEVFPYSYVLVRGRATLSDDPVELERISRLTAERYVPADRVEQFALRNAVEGEWVIRIRPEKFIAFTGIAD